LTHCIVSDRPWGNWKTVNLEGIGYSEIVFFPFYSKIIPRWLWEDRECIAFHMTDLPYGRGGSPLQNLILRGHKDTMISAFRVMGEFDAGPIYLKWPLSLEGTAEQIYQLAAGIIDGMMQEILEKRPEPVVQDGEVVEFKRRKPDESRLPDGLTADQVVDFVRMLDAPGYPRAFVERDGKRYELRIA
jgi:methionyl-tRNA formyltransferase